MPRLARHAPGDVVYHVLNRACARLTLFRRPSDYEAFERVVAEAHARVPGLRILSYVVMPNHWHFNVWPRADGEVTEFFRWLTHTHAMRWHAAHRTVGSGHLYQGRFKCFPAQDDRHLLTLGRYAERNPLRAGLVRRAQDWRWSSQWRRLNGAGATLLCDDWPVDWRPLHAWVAFVNRAETRAELEALRRSVIKGRPFGDEQWTQRTARQFHLAHTLRDRGRPRRRTTRK
jgi:REP-associated tyrosine transposase